MGTFRQRMVAIATVLAVFAAAPSVSRSVNISSSWLLPQNEFPVFYRHFRDRVTWFEADAVCQFHHAQLATVESNSQFEAIRSYLKELDVIENVWIGLKRNSEASEFTWTNYQPLARSGYFREEVPRSSDPVCVVTDPTANFKWHSLHCGGPEVASFVCELPVPYWASKNNGCMTSMMEGMTVTFLPERPAIQLTKECSPGVSKNVTCKGNMKQSEIIEKLSCPNSNKPLKTLFKPVKPEIVDIKLKTTTSSSESDVEDYAIEMATIAQYNDETFQSISKVMGHGSGGIINLPQEMSIAQEPIKSSGRGSFDTNGIDSAFISGQVEATSTGASSISASTSTSTSTASSVSSSSTVTSASTTSTTSPTPKSEPKTSSTMTMKQTTTPTPIATATKTTTHTGSVTYSTASGTTTHATTVNKVTTPATKTGTTGRTVTTIGGQPTGTPTTTSNSNHNRQRGNSVYTTTANTNTNAPIYATTTTTLPKSGPTVQITTTEKIHTVAKMLTAETGDVRRANSRRPTAATLAAIATVVAKIPYTVASTSATRTTSRPLNALRSYANFGDGDVATTRDAPTTEPPIHVYKKIDFPGLPINDDRDYVRKPTATPFSSTSATTFSSPVNRNGNDGVTTRYSTPLAMAASTTISASARPSDALNNTYPAAAETATTNMVSDTSSPVASVTVGEADDDTNNWNVPSSPSSLPTKIANDAVTTTMASASVTAAFDATSTATDVAATTVTAATTTTARTTSTITPAESTSTVAATTTAAPANHRKIANYDAYTDHPNRSRHIVRPKQQHHHSYPYILYRLLG
ncbi:mucin-22 [Acyrthosiphon pisum]|uniref:C-type lectin domain-containing protein n=1 Tax=Acyrthosiphon pisum TaxID=7029 RepID=A0A8R2NK69_ACYPI|nr:mucin-22 [Acyrthosiphon pisum]